VFTVKQVQVILILHASLNHSFISVPWGAWVSYPQPWQKLPCIASDLCAQFPDLPYHFGLVISFLTSSPLRSVLIQWVACFMHFQYTQWFWRNPTCMYTESHLIERLTGPRGSHFILVGKVYLAPTTNQTLVTQHTASQFTDWLNRISSFSNVIRFIYLLWCKQRFFQLVYISEKVFESQNSHSFWFSVCFNLEAKTEHEHNGKHVLTRRKKIRRCFTLLFMSIFLAC
jgi:hypothetical protein